MQSLCGLWYVTLMIYSTTKECSQPVNMSSMKTKHRIARLDLLLGMGFIEKYVATSFTRYFIHKIYKTAQHHGLLFKHQEAGVASKDHSDAYTINAHNKVNPKNRVRVFKAASQ